MKLYRSALIAMVAVGLSATTGCRGSRSHGDEDTSQQGNQAPPPAPAPAPAPPCVGGHGHRRRHRGAGGHRVDGRRRRPPPAGPGRDPGRRPQLAPHLGEGGLASGGRPRYVWQPGYWADQKSYATSAPPPLKVEVQGTAPAAGYFYAPGYWHWGGREYARYPGHWAQNRAGWAYAHPYWESVNGRWYRRGYGWGAYDAGWRGRYNGWLQRDGVWVHHGYVGEWDRRWHHH